MGEPMFDPQHDARRVAPVPPDQDQRLRPDDHGYGRPRRARPWIVLAAGLFLIVAFVVIVLAAGGDVPDETGASAAVADA